MIGQSFQIDRLTINRAYCFTSANGFSPNLGIEMFRTLLSQGALILVFLRPAPDITPHFLPDFYICTALYWTGSAFASFSFFGKKYIIGSTIFASLNFLRNRTTPFASFSGKKKNTIRQLDPWGKAPKPPGSASPRLGFPIVFCEQKQASFWKGRTQ
jgi:hypothetical protein